MGIDLANPGEPRNDLMSAKNKYDNGQALGFDLLNSTGSGGFSWTQGSVVTSPTVSASIVGGGTRFTAPASVTITSSTTGTVAKIEFWVNGKKKGEITGSARQWTFSNVQPGNYEVMVRALDSTGRSGTSAPVRFTVA